MPHYTYKYTPLKIDPSKSLEEHLLQAIKTQDHDKCMQLISMGAKIDNKHINMALNRTKYNNTFINGISTNVIKQKIINLLMYPKSV